MSESTDALVAAKTAGFLEWLEAPDETFERDELWAERLLRHLQAADWDVMSRAEVAAIIVSALDPLILSFRRWCQRGGIEPPTVEEFRQILAEASEIRDDLDRADAVGVGHDGIPLLRKVHHTQ